MTLKSSWRRIAPIACALMMASCAASRPISTVAPPRLTLPEVTTRPCALAVLPPSPTEADLEVGYLTRGTQIVACDAARRLLLETIQAERAMQDRWQAGS